MQEVQTKQKTIKVYVNGLADISLMPKEEYKLLVTLLEMEVALLFDNHYNKKTNTHKGKMTKE